MHIQIFDRDFQRLQSIQETIGKAAQTMAASMTVETITSPDAIAEAGIFSVPAVCIDGKVFASGYMPNSQEITRWLSRLGIPGKGPHAYACICGSCAPKLFQTESRKP